MHFEKDFSIKFLPKLITKVLLFLLFKIASNFNKALEQTWTLILKWALTRNFSPMTRCLYHHLRSFVVIWDDLISHNNFFPLLIIRNKFQWNSWTSLIDG